MARRDQDDPREDSELSPDASEASSGDDQGVETGVSDDDDLELLEDDDLEPSDDDESDDDEVAAEPDDDDDDELEAEPESDDDDELEAESDAPEPPPRRSLGPTLLTLGGGVWAIAAALRCGAPEPGPALSVSPDAAPLHDKAETRDGDDDEGARWPDRSDDPEPAVADPDQADPAAAGADRPDIDEEQLDDEPPPPEPEPEDWATDPSPPSKVAYTIRHGGSIKNVANLFKIFHHEITALNPGYTLDQELPPNSKVVVYLEEGQGSSESVGFPSGGTLEGGVPMVEGPGRVLKMIPWKSWGTAHTVALLDRVLRQWAKRDSKVQPVLVGNMAARKGGRLEPHSTHQSGRDVDISYIQKLPDGEELNWREMNKANLDAAETWALLKLLRSTGQVEVIFIDSSIQKLLYDHAVAQGTVPKGELSRWLQYPKSGGRRSLVQHVKGHVDHIHVRFKCQSHESRCKSKQR